MENKIFINRRFMPSEIPENYMEMQEKIFLTNTFRSLPIEKQKEILNFSIINPFDGKIPNSKAEMECRENLRQENRMEFRAEITIQTNKNYKKMDHETLRKQVWAKAYLSVASEIPGKNCVEVADAVLRAFDVRFPTQSEIPLKIIPERDTQHHSEPFEYSEDGIRWYKGTQDVKQDGVPYVNNECTASCNDCGRLNKKSIPEEDSRERFILDIENRKRMESKK